MSDLLLQTKLFKPTLRSSLITRTHLINRLNESLGIGTQGFAARLALVCAPAGFGKTTLVSAWLKQLTNATPQFLGCVTAWLSLDESDNDPVRFLTYLIAALQTAVPKLGEMAVQALQSPQPPPHETILTLLINDISQNDQLLILVLDDYHIITTPAIHQALAFLLEHLPPQLHLLLTSRSDPMLPLSRLRARGQVVEIRSNDLRFTIQEVDHFLNLMMGLNLSAEALATLERRTEGWIAGLQLAALSMEGHDDLPAFIAAFAGSDHFILDYLSDEVLERRPKGTKNFLLQTAILDRFCGPLCDAVTGGQESQAILEQLEQANLFLIPLDNNRRWYRYHHLFAEVLQRRLRQTQPGQVSELYQRASEWLEESGASAEAVEYALRAADWTRAMRLIEANIQGAQLRGEIATLLRWMGTLPDEAIQVRPKLGLAHAWLLVIVDDFAAAAQRLAIAERALRSNPLPDAHEQAALLGQAAAVREVNALMLEYPGEEILAAGREALGLLPESDLARRGYALNIIGCAYYLQLGDVREAEQSFQEALPLSQSANDMFSQLQILAHLSQMRAVQGRLSAAEAPCEELLRLASQPDWKNIPAAGMGRVMHGRILYERNNLSDALQVLTTGIVELEDFSLKRAEIIGCILLARVKLALGEIDETRAILDHTWYTIQKFNLRQITMPAAAYRARLLLQMGDLKTAAQWAETIEHSVDDPLNPALEYDYMVVARVQLAQGRLVEAQQLLARLLPPAQKAGRMSRVIELLVLQAVVAAMLQDKTQAVVILERALALGEPEGFVRSFVDEGAVVANLLRQVRQHGLFLNYIDTLLAAFSTDESTPGAANLLPDPLSERELEVLRLVAKGASNQDIADQLVIALSTAKKHVSNMLVKLDTPNRTQAAARARELGLLP